MVGRVSKPVVAQESPQVLRARKRLKNQIADEGKKKTPQALKNTAQLIEHWIMRHQPERINLKDKTVTLFDENRHSEKSHNRHIEHLTLALKGIPRKPSKSLKGRITNT